VVGSTLGTLQHGAPLAHYQVHPQDSWALDTQREGVREVVCVEVVVVLVVVVAIYCNSGGGGLSCKISCLVKWLVTHQW